MRGGALRQTVKLLLIRHGETEGNREKRYIGRTDEALSEEGRAALLEKRQEGCYPEVSDIYVSSMRRCIETASVIYPGKTQVIVNDLREMDFGIFEGKNYLELAEDAEYRKWVDGLCEGEIPQGESRAVFEERCARAFAILLEKHDADITEQRETAVALVVHGGTIMALLHRFGRPRRGFYDWHCGNGEMICCEVKKEQGRYYLEVCGEDQRCR